MSKDPPAEPGAFKREPPKAALLWPLTSGIGACGPQETNPPVSGSPSTAEDEDPGGDGE